MKLYSLLFIVFRIVGICAAKDSPIVFSGDTTITQNIEIPESLSCTIKPGTTLRFSGYYKFIVHGLLIAQGTATDPITFTCSGRTHGAALPPCWYGFAIMGPSGQADFRNCRFEGMYRGFAWQSAPLFDSCEFAGNHYALYCTKKASPLIRNCKFYRNVYAIVADNAAPLLRNNVISQNTIGVYLQAGAQPMAGPNIIAGNTENMRAEPALKGDTTALAIRRLWELMNQLY